MSASWTDRKQNVVGEGTDHVRELNDIGENGYNPLMENPTVKVFIVVLSGPLSFSNRVEML
jgi:hypothetical protein